MAWQLSKFWQLRGQLLDGAEWATSIAQSGQRPTAAVALTLSMAAYFQLWTGHSDRAQSLVDQALNIAEDLQDPEALAWTHYMRLVVCLFSVGFGQAEEEGRVAIGLADAADVAWLRASARITLGAALLYEAQPQEAATLLAEGQDIAVALGERFAIGLAAMYLGHLAKFVGDDRAAEVHYKRSLQVLEEAANTSVMLTPANALAQIALKRGEATEALRRYGRTLELGMRVGRRDAIGNALAGVGMALATIEDASFAPVLFGVVEALRSAIGIRPLPADAALEAQFVALAKLQLGEVTFGIAFKEGARMDLFEACRATLDRIGSYEIGS
jgi:hypothetical protein